MNRPSSFRLSLHLIAVAAVAAAALVPALPADAAPLDPDAGDEPFDLAEMVVSATRSPLDINAAPSSVTLVSLSDLKNAQIDDLGTALSREAGVNIVQSGAEGSQTSVFVRGASSHQTLFVVDGVRMNDRAAAYINFLGGADLGGLERLEILRGPQSTLYGSSAMGGVILLETAAVGDAAPTGSVSATGGSFDTWGGSLAARGRAGVIGYSASVSRFSTDNDQPANGFDSWNYSGRLEYRPDNAPLLFGLTHRGQDGAYEETGSRLFPSAGTVDSSNALTTAFVQWQATDGITSRLTLAQHDRDYRYAASWGATVTENQRRMLDWLNTWSVSEKVELVGGLNFERSRYTINGDSTRDRVGAGYVTGTFRPAGGVTLIAGVRYDDFDSVGDATTWRTGVAWDIAPTTKLRATLGTGFSAPGSDDRWGVSQWGQVANPEIKPEESLGWDIGIDQSFASGVVVASATYFNNRYENLFEWAYLDPVNFSTYDGYTANRARASTEGVELGATTRIARAVQTRVTYTYLDARNDSDGVRLIRRPRHTADLDVYAAPTEAWMVGFGVHLVADRVDSAGPAEDYTTVRVYSSYRAAENLLLKVRVENALDENYEEAYGYPALPIGVYGGVEWRF